MANPTILLYVSTDAQGGTFFRLDDAVRGVLDNVVYPLAGAVAVDVTQESQSISTNRGRRSEFESISAGSATVGWPNDKRQFDPLYSGSPFFGVDLVGLRIQVLIDDALVFDGLTEDWDYDHVINGVSWATVSALDQFTQLGREEFDDWTTTQELPGARLTEVLNRNEVRFGANRLFDPGVSVLQADNVTSGSSVLNYLLLVAKSDLGRLFIDRSGVLTFQDRHSTLNQPAEAVFADSESAGIIFQSIKRTSGTELIYNRVSVDREGGIKQTSEDAASQAKYGIRSLTLSGLLLNDDTTAAAMADYLLTLYAFPVTRVKSVSVVLDGMAAAKAAVVTALDLGDVVEVLFTPDGRGAEIDQLVIVEGISHSLTPSGMHSVTLSFATADGRTFFQLDDPVRGVLDAGNVLAF